MTRPAKRNSDILQQIRDRRNPAVFKKARRKMWLAATIAEGIKNKGWNKSEFAKMMGQEPSVVSRWLSGVHNFTIDTLDDIGDMLGIDVWNWEKRQRETEKTVNGTIPSRMAVNIFVVAQGYSSVSGDQEVLVEISRNMDNVQIIKECDPAQN